MLPLLSELFVKLCSWRPPLNLGAKFEENFPLAFGIPAERADSIRVPHGLLLRGSPGKGGLTWRHQSSVDCGPIQVPFGMDLTVVGSDVVHSVFRLGS